MPKALVRDPDGTSWLRRSVASLREGGCAGVTVVLGAAAEQAHALVPRERVVVAPGWEEGMGASLRAGLRAVVHPPGTTDQGLVGHVTRPDEVVAVLVSLVDLPDVGPDVVRRVLCAATGAGPAVLARAAYGGVPGHPVLLGREHWAGVAVSAAGDRGARDYLLERDVALVECGDLATGTDRDTPGSASGPPPTSGQRGAD